MLLAVTPENPRSMSADELCEIGSKYTEAYAFSCIDEALENAYETLTEKSALFVVGSLYLAGEVRAKLLEQFS